LVDWTEITSPSLPTGEIIIPSSVNRIDTYIDRYVTIHANYDIERKDAFKTLRYQLKNSPNTTVLLPD
jgi:hypothetical protein